MRVRRSLCPLLAALLLLASDSRAEPVTVSAEGESDAEVLARGNTEFALQLHRLLAAEGGNSVISPLSVSMASAMLYAGARGETRDEIASALEFGLAPGALDAAFWRLRRDLLSRVTRWAELNLANALWVDDDCSPEQDYEELLSHYYGAVAREIDLGGSAGAACSQINQWVSAETNGRIGPVVRPEMLGPLTRAVLVNAVYFLGAWEHGFSDEDTSEEPFHVSDGRTVRAQMMHRNGRHRCYEDDSVQVLELEYQGSGLSMLIVLPDVNTGLVGVEASLTSELLASWVGGLEPQRLTIAIPRFEAEQQIDLVPLLEELGMTSAFRLGAADLTGVCPDPQLFVSHAQQLATLGITEKGTEAAAATVYVITAGSEEVVRETVKEFRADRPFIYILRDMKRGTILFMGRVVDPTPGGTD